MKISSAFVRYDLPVILKMMLPTLFLVAIGLHYEEFIWNAVLANKAINAGIIITALCGVTIILFRLISMQRDMSSLNRFSREAQETGDMKQLLDMPWLKGRAIRHYLENLAHTGGTLSSQLDQDAIQNELNALLEEYNSKLELPQFLVGFMVAMGLLGTFIGLLETLTGISGMLDGMGHGGDIEKEFSNLVVELRKPLSGMGIAFSASMFGLVTSLQLSIKMIMLRRYMSRVMEKARNVMHKLLTRIKSSSPINAQSLSAVAPISDKVSEAYFRSQDAITAMANSVTLLVKRMEGVSKSLETNIDATQKTNALLSFGPRMTEANEYLLSEVRSMVAAQDESQKQMQKIVGSLIQIDQSLFSNSTRDVVVAQRETTAALGEMFSNTQTHTRLFTEILEDQRTGTRDLIQTIKTLSERIVKQEEIYIGSSQCLFEIKEGFSKAINSFALIDTVAENIGKQTLLVESSIAEERNTQVALISSIHRELRSFTDELRQAFNMNPS